MQNHANATVGATGGGSQMARESSLLVNVLDVAVMLQCSPRHVCRLVTCGLMPKPYKIGNLTRWDRAAVQTWIQRGCQSCVNGGAK